MQGPGEQIIERLRRLEWTQADLARIVDRTPTCISEIIRGKRSITTEMATLLSVALGDNASFWLEQDAKFRAQIEPELDLDRVRERMRVFQVAPVRDMQRRGWITDDNDLERIAHDLCKFFHVSSLQESIGFPVSTRRAGSAPELNNLQRAWCFRARNIAETLPAAGYASDSVDALISELRGLAWHTQEARKVSEVLASFGVRFVIVEHIQGSQIDGAAFWLDVNSPVVVMSLRYDRMDYFWHTLMHECAHVKHLDAFSVDSNLVGDGQTPPGLQDEAEQRADRTAATSLVDDEELDSFIRRVGPLYSKPKLIGFAKRIGIHPAIVVGQLQHRGEIGWNAHRSMLEKVRNIVTDTAVVDGWGRTLPPSVI